MDLQHLPVIDWELSVKLAGNKRDIAEEILELLIRNLPSDIAAINQSFQHANYVEMRKNVHKLHGALCYCGLPRLKTLVSTMEMDLKNNKTDDLQTMMSGLNHEVEVLLSQYVS